MRAVYCRGADIIVPAKVGDKNHGRNNGARQCVLDTCLYCHPPRYKRRV
jgi:hypothetical protein